ncbi:hypothetical protein Y032_0553g3356 [Ancylostoma ceylanicum]|uniref:EF-hand domain-containing protein n=2 Tax=Ancylostoma ceylanicum TaxID=53326 RepID=A0A016WRD5_9BILA|nr:hypothetical protein Y032_0553g3356 [Ancylostoma ceylanicum]
MADPELASKLARRLENIDVPAGSDESPAVKEPPPAPVLPEKVIPNPYVASDDSVSIDDLIAKTLERNERLEENNNNVGAVATSNGVTAKTTDVVSPAAAEDSKPDTQPAKPTPVDTLVKEQRPASPMSGPTKAPPPKTTIGELIVKDQKPLPPPAASRCPVVPIQHHLPKHETKQRLSPEDDGSELERKLAAQRAKKHYDAAPSQESNVIFSNSNGPADSGASQDKKLENQTSPEPLAERLHKIDEPAQPSKAEPVPSQNSVEVRAEVHADSSNEPPNGTPSAESIAPQKPKEPSPPPPPPPPPLPSLLKKEVPNDSVKEDTKEEPKQEAKEDTKQALKGPLDPDDLRSLMMEELKKSKVSVEEMIVLKGMEQRKGDKAFSPSKELLEMIHRENGIRSPPPVPPPKPQTPSHSRPQSPSVAKKFSFGQASSVEQKMFAERQNKPNPPLQKQALSVDSGDELSALLERRNKINQGETAPEMIHRKLSLYAEFSEFSRKQIKFFTDTFKKYDEDCDGFIDFDELKRMMEKLGEAQTHIALKEIIRKVDEDQDGKISLREFFLIFRLAAQNQLGCSEVFQILADSVDVSKEGVLGAANFFQAKIEEQTKLSRFEQEMKEEQEERKRQEEEKKARREKFLQNKSIFQ